MVGGGRRRSLTSDAADDDVILNGLVTELDQAGGRLQLVDEVACGRLSTIVAELFQRHCTRVADMTNMMTSLTAAADAKKSEDGNDGEPDQDEDFELKESLALLEELKEGSVKFLKRLTAYATEVCSQIEDTLKTLTKHVVNLRTAITQICDTVEQQVTETTLQRDDLTARGTDNAADNSKDQSAVDTQTAVLNEDKRPNADELRRKSTELVLKSRQSEACVSLARTSSRVAMIEERLLTLERDARKANNEAIKATEVANEARRKAAEEAEKWEEEERLRREEREELERQQREEQARAEADERKRKARDEEWRRRCAQLTKKRSSMFDMKTTEFLVYPVDPGDTGLDVGCVLRTERLLLDRDSIHVTRVRQLDVHKSLLADNEQLVSNVIRVQSDVNVMDLECWPAIAVPYVQPQRTSSSREMVLKSAPSSTGRWNALPSIEMSFEKVEQIKDYKFVEAPFRCSDVIYLAVVTRLKRDRLVVTRSCRRVCASVDPRLELQFDTVPNPPEFNLEFQPVEALTVQEVRQAAAATFKEATGTSGTTAASEDVTCSKLVSCSPIIRIFLGESGATDKQQQQRPTVLNGPVTIAVPVPSASGSSGSGYRPRPCASAGSRRHQQLLSGRHSSLGHTDGVREGTRSTSSAKTSNSKSTNSKNKRPSTAHLITYRGSIFFDDPVVDDLTTVHLLCKTKANDHESYDGASTRWTLMSAVKPVETKQADVVTVQLDKIVEGSFMLIRKSPGGTLSQLETVASRLEVCARRQRVCVLLRQKHEEDNNGEKTGFSHVIVQLVPRSKLERLMKSFADEGFEVGPPASADIDVFEGQKIVVKFRGNICPASGDNEFQLVYNTNIRTRLDVRLAVVDRYAQHSIDVYRGFIQLWTNSKYTVSSAASAPPPEAAKPTGPLTTAAALFAMPLMDMSNFRTGAIGNTVTDVTGTAASICSIVDIAGSSTSAITVPGSKIQLLSSETVETAGSPDVNKRRKVQSRKGMSSELTHTDVLLCELLASVPKIGETAAKPAQTGITRNPAVINTEGAVDAKMLRHLAIEIGDQWRELVLGLGVPRVKIESIIRNHVSDDDNDAIVEMLTSWLKRLPRAADKAGILCAVLKSCERPDLVAYVAARNELVRKDLMNKSQHGSGLRRAMVTVARHAHMIPDWTALCRRLGLTAGDIDTIRYRYDSSKERCLQSLTRWIQDYSGHDEPTVSLLLALLRDTGCEKLADLVQKEYESRQQQTQSFDFSYY